MKIPLPGTNKVIYLRALVLDFDRTMVGLQSGGRREGSHWLFIDFDSMEKMDAVLALERVTRENGLRRSILVESSPGNYHGLSFSPMKFDRMLSILQSVRCDKRHISCTLRDGKATLRFSRKEGNVPRLISEVTNPGGTNFYDYDSEKAYKELIGWHG